MSYSLQGLVRQFRTGISREQLARLAEQTPVNSAVTLSVVLLILAFVAAQGSAPWIYVWAAAQAGLILVVFLRWWKTPRRPAGGSEYNKPPTRSGLHQAVIWAALSGGLWGCLTAFLPDAPPHIQLALILTMGGMAAGASATLAAVPQVAIIFILGCGIPVTAYHLVLGDQTGLLLALVFAVFTAAMIGTSQVVSVAVMRQLRAEERVRQLQEADLLRGIAEKANAALRESEQRFRDYTEASSDWVWETNADLRFTYMSGNVERMIGVTPEWHYGKTREDFIGDDYDRDAWARHLETLREHRPFRNFEFLRVADGVDPVWIRSSGVPIFAEDGAFLGYRGTASDITKRKQAEEALRESEEKFSRTFHVSPGLFAISRPEDGAHYDVNMTWMETTGYSHEEAMAHSALELGIWADVKKRERFIARLEKEGSVRDFEAKFRTKDGGELDVLVAGEYMEFRGEPRLLIVSHDITERKRAEEQLRQAQKMEAVGQLTGGIAHDFNNLLTIILGSLKMLQRGLKDDEKSQEWIAAALDGGRRGAELTKQLLSFARLQPLDSAIIDVNEVIADLGKFMHRTLGEHVEIRIKAAKDLWPVELDANQLGNALLNVAVNARDAMPQGGRLTIETSNVHLDDSYAARHHDVQPGRHVMIAISDTGTGMPPDVVDKVFEPFFTTKAAGKGTGLGLSMVFGFTKQSEGHVNIYSEEGHGTTIELCFPRSQAAEATTGQTEIEEFEPPGTESILVVEDDPAVRYVTVIMLQELGYTAIVAENGPAALRILDERPKVDLLFTDMIMPGGMHGAELATAARECVPGLKVLYSSGYTADIIAQAEKLDEGIKLISKPYSLARLAQMVRQVLDN